MEKQKKSIMVCVTNQKSCERLISHGKDRQAENSELYIVHCVHTGQNFMNSVFESDAVEYLFTAAQIAGAQLSLLRADNVDDALVDFASQNNVDIIIMGASPSGSENNIVMRLQRRLPSVEFDVVG